MKIRKENGYCAPIALKTISGLSDKKVLRVCHKYGFRTEWGMEDYEVLKAASEMGIRYRRVELKQRELYGVKLGRFAKEYPAGTFLVYTNQHILVVMNGVIIDPINDGYIGEERAVTGAWKIFK